MACAAVKEMLLPIGNHVDCFRKDYPLCLLHNPSLQDFRGIPFLHFHCLLEDNGAGIHAPVHIVDRGSCHLHASGQGCLMNLKPIVTHTAERGNQAWMDIDDTPFILNPADVEKAMEAMKAAGEAPYVVGSIEEGEKGVSLC